MDMRHTKPLMSADILYAYLKINHCLLVRIVKEASFKVKVEICITFSLNHHLGLVVK